MPRRNYSKIEINGQVKSLKQWCEQTGVEPRRARQRITDLGWPEAEAVGVRPRSVHREPVIANAFPDEASTLSYKGRTLTFLEWHQKTGIPLRTLYDRYHRGWEIPDILDPDRHNSRAKRLERTRKARLEAIRKRTPKAAK